MAVNGRAELQTRQLYHRAEEACPGVRANGLAWSSGMGINLGDNLSALVVGNVLRPHLHRTTAMSKLYVLANC